MTDYKGNPKYVFWEQKYMYEDPIGFYSKLLEAIDTLREYTSSEMYGDLKDTMIGIRQRILILDTTSLDCITGFSEEIKSGLEEYVRIIDGLAGLKGTSASIVGKEPIKNIEPKSHWLGDECYDPFSEGKKTIGGLK